MEGASISSSQGVMLAPSRVVIGLDFGTTFSGFAFAMRTNPERLYTVYDWEAQLEYGGKPYCKTTTSSLYEVLPDGTAYRFQAYGYPAILQNIDYLFMPRRATTQEQRLLQRFKLHLAPTPADGGPPLGSVPLPDGLTVQRAIGDYLAEMKAFALAQVRKHFILEKLGGRPLRDTDVQWCLTVPAIWEDKAKQAMKQIAEAAGLVGPQGSPHPLILALEPEAAALYCAKNLRPVLREIQDGEIFLVVDAGGGTIDLVVEQKITGGKLKEVSCSSGSLCGGTFVDDAFHSYLKGKVSCYERFQSTQPRPDLKVKAAWDSIKKGFKGTGNPCILELPSRLAKMWGEEGGSGQEDRDQLEISIADLKTIFDPVVNEVLALIRAQLDLVPACKYIFLVGGFSASPYLTNRVKESFPALAENVLSPEEPGTAVCQGPVLFALEPTSISERISKRTYGIGVLRSFREGIDAEEHRVRSVLSNTDYCNHPLAFYALVRKGERLGVDMEISKDFPFFDINLEARLILLSSQQDNLEFSTDLGVMEEGSFDFSIPRTDENGVEIDFASICREDNNFNVKMRFGTSVIEMTAEKRLPGTVKPVKLGVTFQMKDI